MQALLDFLTTYEFWIYFLLGVAAIIYLRRLVLAWQEWRAATFGLEKENAQRHINSALAVVAILTLMVVSEFILVSFVAPVFPQLRPLATPTLDLISAGTPTVVATHTLPANINPIGIATEPAVIDTNGCVAGKLEWTFPTAGEEISGVVELKGTVAVENLGFYKYEFNQIGTPQWVTIAAGNQPKSDEALGGAWNTNDMVPGDYLLRLVVTDSLNQVLPACEIPIRVVSED